MGKDWGVSTEAPGLMDFATHVTDIGEASAAQAI